MMPGGDPVASKWRDWRRRLLRSATSNKAGAQHNTISSCRTASPLRRAPAEEKTESTLARGPK